jgi:CRP-like cAMP-binding protein
MIQKLPRKERSTILQNLEVREFKDGDYICTQGEQGKEFFIIQEGSVKVVERRPNPEGGFQDVVLVTLREGHFFGEMSLVTDEPRVANVISIKNTICLSLSKTVFRKALSDETFNDVLREALEKRKEIRKQREREETSSTSSPAPGGANGSSYSRKQSVRARSSTAGQNEVNVSTTLSMKKLESGYRLINKYIVERELGKGSFGEVYLCTDQETKNQYAMKMINRPASSWNDEATNSIRQEIAVLKRLKHQNIVGLHEVIDDQNARKIFLIQEFMEGGPLMPVSSLF